MAAIAPLPAGAGCWVCVVYFTPVAPAPEELQLSRCASISCFACNATKVNRNHESNVYAIANWTACGVPDPEVLLLVAGHPTILAHANLTHVRMQQHAFAAKHRSSLFHTCSRRLISGPFRASGLRAA